MTGAPSAAAARPNYDRIGSYALVNFEAEYAFDPETTVAVGGTNLLDENYELAQGFPRQAACSSPICGRGSDAASVFAASVIVWLMPGAWRPHMRLSARNILKGKIVDVVKGQTTAHVRIDIGGAVVTASITNEAVDELQLKKGMAACAVIKSSDVMVAID